MMWMARLLCLKIGKWGIKMTSHVSDFDREHMEDIVAGYGDWFSAELLRLIVKADSENRELLRKVFPVHVKAYEDWYNR